MNGNPFTKGHAYLIEEASKACDELIVFVVGEEKSSFPSEVRYRLICDGTRDLENVKVVHGGPYIISSATFPQYFERDSSKKATWSAELDAGIFCERIAKELNIQTRFVGTEPYCELTRTYNHVLRQSGVGYGMDLVEIERLKEDDRAVSASTVRALIRFGDWDSIELLVPETTLSYLKSDDASDVLERIREHDGSKH